MKKYVLILALAASVLLLHWIRSNDIRKVSKLLTTKAVTLKLQEGSQEAGYLSAFCPIASFPSLIVIQ